MLRLGVIGYGYWGPNLVRNFAKCLECELVALADQDRSRLNLAKRLYPGLKVMEDAKRLIDDPNIDAIAIATPIATHFPLAKAALESGKHVLTEKPMTASVAEAEELVRLAELHQKVLMVDHTFLYTGAVQKLRSLVSSGELGEVLYYDSVRVNLGLFQHDQNVLWDLAPHDFAIMSHLIDKEPVRISAVGCAPVRTESWNRESVAYVSVEFADHSLAHFHVNWLSPVKVRRTLIGGSRKMVIYDHLDPHHQIKIYDKGVEIGTDSERYEALIQYRTGDLLVPKIDQTEALEGVCNDFVHSSLSGTKPLTDGHDGLRVVRMLEAAQQSIENGREVRSRLGSPGGESRPPTNRKDARSQRPKVITSR